ncbi:MAG: chemotaxis protein CheW [Sulfobacillus thermosulfidooxidans]|uniref:Chemotaxis protein CheW n=1 Tax=Sulfobacillus thermotolerans TaxID=338644 RepID=A0ABM6RRX6_9FIRM|nr:chemotaxis protein CheW [Sulfobacillus sp. hq2]AUW94061.1 chemotaxis protein CheW [Sulfobacillus thermotolerans]MCY0907768.1 chemotaxis protein CheW [Sulfobacillus thermotolerans]POB12269.1 chemotaxis protein CheW [Sulfobacillus sp. hq2]PSR37551.1 MAG: chemotaxis protein CheW [Sulfobacillus thermosulfidooxidans]
MEEQLLTVRVGSYLFGAPVTAVTEILSNLSVTHIPQTPELIAGVAVVRGQPLEVWTLGAPLGLPPKDVGLALRWESSRGVSLVAVDMVESLWTPGPPLSRDLWENLIPQAAAPWVVGAYRMESEWLWAFAPDLPDRLQASVLGSGRVATG